MIFSQTSTTVSKHRGQRISAITLAASLALFANVGAADSREYYQDYRPAGQHYDYAHVIKSRPIYETYQVPDPVEQCWREPAYYGEHKRSSGHNSKTPEILGALIGAAIGNQVGSGRGKKVATVAGAILGGSVGHDIKKSKRRHHHDRHYRDRDVERCEVTEVYREEQRIVGYDVTYKYNGNRYHTQMDHDPGRKIKVRVSVDPV